MISTFAQLREVRQGPWHDEECGLPRHARHRGALRTKARMNNPFFHVSNAMASINSEVEAISPFPTPKNDRSHRRCSRPRRLRRRLRPHRESPTGTQSDLVSFHRAAVTHRCALRVPRPRIPAFLNSRLGVCVTSHFRRRFVSFAMTGHTLGLHHEMLMLAHTHMCRMGRLFLWCPACAVAS